MMEDKEIDLEELPEEEDFVEDDVDEEYQDDDEDAEELFRQNPLRAIFVRQGEILEALNEA